MDELALELPADEQALRAMLQAQARRYEALLAEREAQLERSEQTIEQLRERINVLLAKRYGASSEQVADAQLGLFNEAELEAILEDEAQQQAPTRGGLRARVPTPRGRARALR
jgi:hypothetical protein